MKVYQIHSKQVLPISMEAAWEFLSDPKNLELITPPDMKFTILGDLHGRKTYAGQIINYRISSIPINVTHPFASAMLFPSL